MNAMILAAGKGKRMRPLTLSTPKPLLQVGGKPLIGYHLERLAAAGFGKVVINHAWLGEKIEQALGSGDDYGIRIVYSPEQTALETAGGISQALPLLCESADSGSNWFVVVNGDIWCDFDFARLMVPPTSSNTRAVLVLTDNPCHNPEGDFAMSADGQVHAEGAHKLTFTGISLLHASLFSEISPGVQALAPLLRKAMQHGQVQGTHHQGQWMDIGTPQRLHALDQQLRGVQGEHHGPTTA